MKITKLEGASCLLAAKSIAEGFLTPTNAANHCDGPLSRIGWCAGMNARTDWFDYDAMGDYNADQVMLALTMCATVAAK